MAPGQRPIVLVALAVTMIAGLAGKMATSTGKVRIVPPPATELTAAARQVMRASAARPGRLSKKMLSIRVLLAVVLLAVVLLAVVLLAVVPRPVPVDRPELAARPAAGCERPLAVARQNTRLVHSPLIGNRPRKMGVLHRKWQLPERV